LSAASVQNQGSTMLALARELGNADLRPLDPAASGLAPQPDAVYFRFLGVLVTYPQAWELPIALAAVAALVGAVVLGRRRGLLGAGGVLVAAVSAVGAVVVALVLGAALGALLGADDVGPDAADLLPAEVAAVVLAVLVVLAWAELLRRRYGGFATTTGAATLLAALGAVTAVAVPGASFLLALPALGLALGLGAAVLLHSRPTAATAALAVGTVPTAALLLPFASQVFLVDGVAHGLAVAAFAVALVPCAWSVVGRRGPALPRA